MILVYWKRSMLISGVVLTIFTPHYCQTDIFVSEIRDLRGNCDPLIVFFFISFTTIVSEVHTMSQNCKSSYATATTRDANNNTLYHGGPGQGYGGRGYTPPSVTSNGKYQQMTTKVLFGNRHLDIGAEYVIRQYWKLRSDLERQSYCP
ncbi:unnamed protein product [Arctia plantaginis]|uniref:Uncharacterized protein n=1 Tax=Arctia plantaginis TaxID=874455 RepID=A0A8S0YVR3_ARCPL|nr:unnamed protein product [Arctia plantaginis]